MNAKTSVSRTILAQLGGNQFLRCTGANRLAQSDASLSFRLPMRTKNKANMIIITLMPSDTYRVQFWSVRGTRAVRLQQEFDDVYADQLQDVIERATGVYTTLVPR